MAGKTSIKLSGNFSIFDILCTLMYVPIRVAKKPEFSKPALPLIFDPSRVPAPKKLEAKKAHPALPRP